MATPSLASAVAEGMKEFKGVEPTPESVVETPKETVKEEAEAPNEEATTETPVETELSLEDITKAINKLAINKPTQAMSLIKDLAVRSGLTQAETKTEAKEIVQDATDKILDLARKHFGEENEWLSPKMAAFFKEAVKDLVDDQVKDIRDSHQQTQLDQLNTAFLSEIKNFESKYADFDEKLVVDMTALIDDFPPPVGMSTPKYMETLYRIAGGKGLPKKVEAIPIRKTAPDPLSQLGSEGKGKGSNIPTGSKPMSISDSVAHAMEQVGMKK